MPKTVWKTSTISPGLSAMPPVSGSSRVSARASGVQLELLTWHFSINLTSLSPSIQCNRPIIAKLLTTHQLKKTSSSFSVLPYNHPLSNCLSLSHPPNLSLSTRSKRPAIAKAPTQVNICPACDSAPGLTPYPPSKLAHACMCDIALGRLMSEIRCSKDSALSAP